tara:strand:+ start:816 stop:1907 length:1092 start_codon:yes stop_codon:yes gene_type:complete
MNSEDILIYFVLGSIILVVIIAQIANAIRRSSYKSRYCSDLDDQWSEFGKVSTIDPDGSEYNEYSLRDYYIKTAYNCCALGDFKNTYVSTCQLENIIKQGVRCLDFEIYSVNDKPIIAVSSDSSFKIKETYNSVKFDKILNIINDKAFSGGNCPNSGDPLILHFRMKSNNQPICKEMADSIKTILQPTGRLLGRDYSYENYGTNLGKVPISDLMGKIIIVVDKTNTMFEGTDLDEYVNLASNSVFMRALRNQDIEFAPNPKELIDYNKRQMTLSMPNLQEKDSNVKALMHAQYGVQMIGMCYQNYDENLKYYENMFAQKGHAFLLKPSKLRYKPQLINCPDKQTKNVSYAPRKKQTGYYKLTL